MKCSPPGSSDHGILQARILEWVAMPSSRGSSQLTQGLNPLLLCLVHRRVLHEGSYGASLIAQLVKNLPAMPETPVRFLGLEDPLEKG